MKAKSKALRPPVNHGIACPSLGLSVFFSCLGKSGRPSICATSVHEPLLTHPFSNHSPTHPLTPSHSRTVGHDTAITRVDSTGARANLEALTLVQWLTAAQGAVEWMSVSLNNTARP